MDPAELGKRIKEARLAKKMTQTDVVGDFITRNMLSQIESGNATPSVKTLTYLANVLEMPVNYFLYGSEDANEQTSGVSLAKGGVSEAMPAASSAISALSSLSEMKAAYLRGDYKGAKVAAQKYANEGEPLYDEACCILAMSCMELAKSEKKPREAIRWARSAEKYAQLGIFAKREVRAAAVLLIDELSEKL